MTYRTAALLALGDPTRLTIMERLADRPSAVVDLAQAACRIATRARLPWRCWLPNYPVAAGKPNQGKGARHRSRIVGRHEESVVYPTRPGSG
jgi:hypothetical protein